jgi:uncharacterized protein YyaL (SSP411 family)
VSTSQRANRLISATSPYLLQHAHNPVDWYEWGDEALNRARAESRPILLSIGYAACHWCHVMERESFEDWATAALMNQHFICIKVDREERPDLDAIYMDAVQALTGQGGWPMTVFLTPDGQPFYAGTYFPPDDRHGLPGFSRLLRAIADAWKHDRAQLIDQGRRVVGAIGRTSSARESSEPLTDRILRRAVSDLARTFDRHWGGFGRAPKFPQPMTLDFLLRAQIRGYGDAAEMVSTTLDRMARGGMYDQIGGGFHRYSTDERWLVPHFEKMLYDNAQLALVYVRAWQVTRRPRFRQVAVETLDYLLREMRHPEGGFFSSQDADSEGSEGRFFVWSWDELARVAGEEIALALGAAPPGNWEGTNVLWRPAPFDPDMERRFGDVRPALIATRDRRTRPATDDKILSAWNGLAVIAFAEAGRVLGEERYAEAAQAAGRFVLANLRRNGRLLRSWRDGRAGRPGYADDYAIMAAACLSLYETTFDAGWFHAALRLADGLLELFADHGRGGFFQTGADAEQLVVRPKELFDNAVPSANSAAADVLLRLWLHTGDDRYEKSAQSALRLLVPVMQRAPGAAGQALSALDLHIGPAAEVAVVGLPPEQRTAALIAEVRSAFRPRVVLAAGLPGVGPESPPLLAERTLVGGSPAAYVCERFVCRQPVTSPSDLRAQLEA